MFINALNIIVGPVVFFSIATCISQFSDLSELGRIGAKIMGLYILTSLIAILIGFGAFFIIDPGTPGMALSSSIGAKAVDVATTNISLLDTIVGIVPSNLLKPFVESQTLQIIFLAILCGTSIGAIGKYSKILTDIFEACNSLFLTITTLIAKMIPVAVFAAMIIMIVESGHTAILSVLGMCLTFILGIITMMITYMLILALLGRLNPFTFFKKNLPGMLTSFSLASSNAAMPTNMNICEHSLGISPKVFSFSIPLGATINMDGGSIHLAINALFFAKLYGIEISTSSLVAIAFTIIMLSMGTPGVPGAQFVSLSVLFAQLGIPPEALGLIMGVDSILDMIRTTSNTTGDMVVTTTVASQEHLIDLEIYNS